MTGFKEDGRPFRPAPPASRARLITDESGQSVRLPSEWRFEGTEVSIRKEGDRVILEPVEHHVSMTPDERAAFWARIDGMCDEPFPFPFPGGVRLQWREYDFDS
ncbi:MAG: AbrB/MazE/SpoVT family DNA-binding domain-containing protein [Caulobacter sp.]|nr:AbrB/MazE/SpoVT family DNA-binding domain-containing protein [Caulobacter sp.]